MNMAGPSLKVMLQSAVQSVHWTYIIFWQFCPQQRVLVWEDGYYNGAIKTRKTVQPMEVSTEEAALSRSEQLRELYDSLASGEQQVTENQQATTRRSSVALSPEDLTELEWFYLMCVSFSFPTGVGLVGGAYAKQQHVWLTGADGVDSKVFTRTILAKSAYIKTVVCIPLPNGVVELGTTEKVEETNDFIEHVKLFFMIGNENLILPPPKPALSAHSSNTTLSPNQTPTAIKPWDNAYSIDEDVGNEESGEEEEEEEEDEYSGGDEAKNVRDDGDGSEQNALELLKETCHVSSFQDELLQVGMCKGFKLGSPNDGTSDSHHNLLATSLDDSLVASTPAWSDNFELHNTSNIHLHISEDLAPEDSRYSRTVSTIIHNQLTRGSNSHNPLISYSIGQSSFTKWTPNHEPIFPNYSSQRLLKCILLFLHSNPAQTISSEELTSSANHVLAERRRREKLNERFIMLRTLVPVVTKMDKASILGDTIEYVKQLRRKVQDLERPEKMKVKRKGRVVEVSIIENDALVEMQCRHREGLLLDVMKRLRELGVEVTTVDSCVDSGIFTAHMRAKVKMRKGNNGKRITITQVKNAIDQIISPL